MESSSIRFERLARKFDQARNIFLQSDPGNYEARLFGCDKHRMIRLPPIDRVQIADWEQKYGIELPADLKDFYTQWSSGGAGPSYGVWSLDVAERLYGAQAKYWVGQTCELKPEDFDRPLIPMTDLGGADWSDRWDSNVWSPYWGMLAVSDMGCGMHVFMIVKGPCHSRLVVCDGQLGITPVKAKTIWHWYEHWLDYVISGRHPGPYYGF